MNTDESWKHTFRPEIPSPARMYNYFLGGKDHYPADREAAEKALEAVPGLARGARTNRAFLQRAVRFLAGEAGIRQFLELGAGLPSAGQVHEVAQAIDPACRVVYVDNDPVVLAYGRSLLHGIPNTTIVQHDVQDPEAILADPEVRKLLDFTEPTAVMLVAILHFVTDDEGPADIVHRLMAAWPAGSYLALSHLTADSSAEVHQAVQPYNQATSPMIPRTKAKVESLFAGLTFVEPGLVYAPAWRPDPDTDLREDPARAFGYGGVARKP